MPTRPVFLIGTLQVSRPNAADRMRQRESKLLIANRPGLPAELL
jgi:hypothetical protein